MAGQVHPTAPDAAMLHNNNSNKTSSPPLPLPATYAKPRRQRRHKNACCCVLATLLSLLIALIYVVGVTVLILWLVLKPVHLPKYSLDNVDGNSFSLAGSTLNADFAYNITANNPNRKIGIKYDRIEVETWYSGQLLGESVIPGFYQGHRNVTSLSSELKVVDKVLTGERATALSNQVSVNEVPVLVRGDAKVHVRIGKYTSPGFWVRVDCDVVLGLSPTTVISKSCKLKRKSRSFH